MSEMAILDFTGDTRIQWSQEKPEEVAAAKERFAELRKKGYAPFRVNAKGTQGEQIDAFDPGAERILFVPPLIGG